MSDLFDQLKTHVKNDIADISDTARQQAKQQAISNAMASFDDVFEKTNLKSIQGKQIEPRPIHKPTFWAIREKGRKIMSNIFLTPKLAPTLIGGASLAVIAMVAMQSNLLRLPQSLPTLNQNLTEESSDGNFAKTRISSDAESGTVQQSPTTEFDSDDAIGGLIQYDIARPAPTMPQDEMRIAPSAQMAKQINSGPQAGRAMVMPAREPMITQPTSRDNHRRTDQNTFLQVAETPVSTFSIDVDTAAYSFVRSALNRGTLPPKDAVRIEELINYFPYDYEGPTSSETPFATHIAILPTPWNDQTKLLHIAIKGYDIKPLAQPSAKLTFLLDTSGSMNAPDKLPLLINSFKLLLASLKPDDTVAIVAYAGSAGTVLEPTRASDKSAILNALDRLQAGGSTAGGQGIQRAYQLAEQSFVEGGVNRIILATDGDFNVGISDEGTLKTLIKQKRQTGIFLSVLGFGHGNYNDALMQTLAQNGNGVAAYIDTLAEARKVLVEEASSSLFTIASDVKIQMEFNADLVSEYRLIGYETRTLNRQDFNNDKVDAGDIGSGHSVTAIYEFTPAGGPSHVDPLRYGSEESPVANTKNADEYGFLKLRYKYPGASTSTLITQPVTLGHGLDNIADASTDQRFSIGVAGFGQLLQGGQNGGLYTGTYTYSDVIDLATDARGEDPFGYRAEFITLARLAQSLATLKAR